MSLVNDLGVMDSWDWTRDLGSLLYKRGPQGMQEFHFGAPAIQQVAYKAYLLTSHPVVLFWDSELKFFLDLQCHPNHNSPTPHLRPDLYLLKISYERKAGTLLNFVRGCAGPLLTFGPMIWEACLGASCIYTPSATGLYLYPTQNGEFETSVVLSLFNRML